MTLLNIFLTPAMWKKKKALKTYILGLVQMKAHCHPTGHWKHQETKNLSEVLLPPFHDKAKRLLPKITPSIAIPLTIYHSSAVGQGQILMNCPHMKFLQWASLTHSVINTFTVSVMVSVTSMLLSPVSKRRGCQFQAVLANRVLSPTLTFLCTFTHIPPLKMSSDVMLFCCLLVWGTNCILDLWSHEGQRP